MILVLPICYIIAVILFWWIPFNPKWCLILIIIGGIYDLSRDIINIIGLKKRGEEK